MPGQAKIIIDGDSSKAVGSANKVGTALESAAKKAGGIDGAIGRANENLGKSVLRVGSLITAIKAAEAALGAFNDRANKTAQGNRDSGGGSLSRAKNLARIGVSDIAGAEQVIKSAGGGATISEQDSAIEAFASASEESRLVKLPNGQRVNEGAGSYGQKEFYQYLRLASTGLYSSDELLKRVKRGQALPTDVEAEQRYQAMSPEAKQELNTRAIERANKNRELEALSSNGRGNRLAESDLAARRAENPGAFGVQDTIKGTLGAVPIVGGIATEGIDAGQREIIKLQRDIAESNRDMSNRANLQVNIPTRPDEAR